MLRLPSNRFKSTGKDDTMNILAAQSGGPTAVINATLAGIIEGGKASGAAKIYGARHGIEGVMSRELVDLTHLTADEIMLLKKTPGSALGSCRHRLPEDFSHEDYIKIEKAVNGLGIDIFLYIGGNDSMDTVDKLSRYFEAKNAAVRIVGVPKTIDNDLIGTDHAPGFGSAAKYLAVTMGEMIRDTAVYNAENVLIVETMGRNAGWLTLAAGFPYFLGSESPDIILLPEIPFDEDGFTKELKRVLTLKKRAIVVASEGLKDPDGQYVQPDANQLDVFGHVQLSGVGNAIEHLIKTRIGCKTRVVEPNILQRCGAHLVSLTDLNESVEIGRAAVKAAVNGHTGIVMGFKRVSDKPYRIEIIENKAADVANREKKVPKEWFDLRDANVKKAVLAYLLPLIQGSVEPEYDENGLPKHFVV